MWEQADLALGVTVLVPACSDPEEVEEQGKVWNYLDDQDGVK